MGTGNSRSEGLIMNVTGDKSKGKCLPDRTRNSMIR